jgi:hypothetical protein
MARSAGTYVHGDIDRRGFLEGARKFATGGATAMALWESLRPNYAWAMMGVRSVDYVIPVAGGIDFETLFVERSDVKPLRKI